VDEFAADTDPLDSSDVARITAMIPPRQLVIAGPFVTDLTWTSKPSRKYDIEVATDLTMGFMGVVTNIVPSAGSSTAVQFNDPGALKKFYRIRARRPLTP
jgi:hypothetical protein